MKNLLFLKLFFFHKDHDIILLSDNDTLRAKAFLSRVGLLKYFTKVISREMTITDAGKLEFEFMERTSCPLGGVFLCKGQELMDFIKGKNYQKVLYFADGDNDYCPVVKLTQNDRVFPRKDFGLDQRIAKEGNVKAQVQSWTSGVDLLSLLKL